MRLEYIRGNSLFPLVCSAASGLTPGLHAWEQRGQMAHLFNIYLRWRLLCWTELWLLSHLKVQTAFLKGLLAILSVSTLWVFFLEMLCDIPHIHGVTTAGRHYPRTSEAFRGSCITMPFPQSSRCGNTFAFASTIYVVTNYNLNCS
jgi:hypothetical protein